MNNAGAYYGKKLINLEVNVMTNLWNKFSLELEILKIELTEIVWSRIWKIIPQVHDIEKTGTLYLKFLLNT